jgi:hypothetical protein
MKGHFEKYGVVSNGFPNRDEQNIAATAALTTEKAIKPKQTCRMSWCSFSYVATALLKCPSDASNARACLVMGSPPPPDPDPPLPDDEAPPPPLLLPLPPPFLQSSARGSTARARAMILCRNDGDQGCRVVVGMCHI